MRNPTTRNREAMNNPANGTVIFFIRPFTLLAFARTRTEEKRNLLRIEKGMIPDTRYQTPPIKVNRTLRHEKVKNRNPNTKHQTGT